MEKSLIDYKINNPFSEAEYIALAAIAYAWKSIKLGPDKLCSRDMTLLNDEGVSSFIIEEPHEQNSHFIERSINIKTKRMMAKNTNRVSKYIKMGKCILQKTDHQDTVTLI